MSSALSSLLPLAYREADGQKPALLLESAPGEEPSPVVVGVSEEEVERRIQIARAATIAEANQRLQEECETATKKSQERIAAIAKEFCEERAEYFRRVEGEVVQLALSIARKILQREVELDPTLLTALVRVALDRMQYSSKVLIRVAVQDARLWRSCEHGNVGSSSWTIVADETLNAGDCVVETDLGTADFGFDAQLRDVEESFMQLLARRPVTQSHDATTA